jgi:hypothetical protein
MRDVWGEPIANQGSLGPNWLNAIAVSRVNNDPVNRELVNLEIFPAPVARKIRGVPLTDEQHDDYQRVAGRLARMSVAPLLQAPGWGDLPEFARKEMMVREIEQARESARTLILMQNPALIEAATAAKTRGVESMTSR